MKSCFLGASLFVIAGHAAAEVTVTFDEGAPKDRFTLSNAGTCPLSDVAILLDLGTAPAGLIFDVTGSGAGVSVYQPLEIVTGRDSLYDLPEVRDGDNQISLLLKTLAPGAEIAFTIDVDDTAGLSETRVSGSEIEGARVVIGPEDTGVSALFSRDATAQVAYDGCRA